MAVKTGVVKFANDDNEVPPAGTSYHRYSWLPMAPEADNPTAVLKQPEPLVKKGGAGGIHTMNPGLVAVPPGVVTETLPEVPDPTTAVILVAETTVNEEAAVPPKVTDIAPVKLVPVIVTMVPLPALVGMNEVMVGAGINVNPGLVAVPPGVVTETFPEVPKPTTAVILVADTTINEEAVMLPKLTVVAPVKLVPLMVTVVPLPALIGVNEVMVGAGINMNPGLVAVPLGVVTETFPDVPPATTAVMLVAETTVNEVAAVPPKLTAVALVKLVPVMVTVVPLTALVGVNEVMVGAGTNVNPGLVAVPPGVVTETFPDVPPATTAVMLVAETTIIEVAAVPPKLTAVAPVKLVPVTVTVVPLPALVGVNEVIVGNGGEVTLKGAMLACVHSPLLSLART